MTNDLNAAIWEILYDHRRVGISEYRIFCILNDRGYKLTSFTQIITKFEQSGYWVYEAGKNPVRMFPVMHKDGWSIEYDTGTLELMAQLEEQQPELAVEIGVQDIPGYIPDPRLLYMADPKLFYERLGEKK